MRITSSKGVTLIELLIAIILSSIVILGAFRFFQGIQKNYTVGDQVNVRNQNVQYALNKLSDIISSAGASLDSAVSAITVVNDSSIIIITNPRGGIYTFPADMASVSYTIPVDNHAGYINAPYIFRHQYNSTVTEILPIDITYNIAGTFVKGIDTAQGQDAIRLSPLVGGGGRKMQAGDVICAMDSIKYYLKAGNICIDADTAVLAENIDSLNIKFLTTVLPRTYTTSWGSMQFASLFVRGRTSQKDPSYPGGYRRTQFAITFPIKSRIR